MMNQGNGRPPVHVVSLVGMAKSRFRFLHAQAAEGGRGHEFLANFRRFIERLRHQPREFGEPLYRLPALKLAVYMAIQAKLVVHYAVHDEKPLVFIRGFNVLS